MRLQDHPPPEQGKTASEWPIRRISRHLGLDRKTTRRYLRLHAGSRPTRPAVADPGRTSQCSPHSALIEPPLDALVKRRTLAGPPRLGPDGRIYRVGNQTQLASDRLTVEAELTGDLACGPVPGDSVTVECCRLTLSWFIVLVCSSRRTQRNIHLIVAGFEPLGDMTAR